MSIVLIAAPIWAPLMLGIGAAIKLLSSGPMLFRQERIGLGGTRFVCLKFRTMHTGADTLAHEKYLADLIRSNRPMTKLDGQDPRLIPLAWILRSTGLDELPQLFNVLQGEMSLVGPRPSTPQEYNAWSRAQRARVRTLPGLTGLWQVNGKNRTTFSEMIELDVRYVETMCLWLDLAIMLRTPATLLAQVADTVLKRTHLGPSLGGIARTLIQKPGRPVRMSPARLVGMSPPHLRSRHRDRSFLKSVHHPHDRALTPSPQNLFTVTHLELFNRRPHPRSTCEG